MVADRDLPMAQCTKTAPPLERALSMNAFVSEKCFSRTSFGSSSSLILWQTQSARDYTRVVNDEKDKVCSYWICLKCLK